MCVVDRFQCLWHHPIICSNDQYHDVGCLCATSPHARKRLVTRSVEEHDLPSVSGRLFILDSNLVRPDVLRDAASLTLGHARGANGIEQRCLAMINVAHDRDHRRTRYTFNTTFFSCGRVGNFLLCLFFKADDVRIGSEKTAHFGGQLRVERLIDGGEYATRQKAGDQILGANAQLFRQILDADAFSDGDVARDRKRFIRDHEPRRRNKALHRAFLHAARYIALARPSRRATRPAARAGGSRRRSKPRTYSQWARASGTLTGGMHGASLSRAQGPWGRRNWALPLKYRLPRHRASRSGTRWRTC